MNISPDSFHFEGIVLADGEYTDFEFTDKSSKSIRRLWVLTYSVDEDHWYATLRRSETDDGGFDWDSPELPAKIVQALRRCAMSNLTVKGTHHAKL